MAIKPITISFKNSTEDIELHEWISRHSNYSGFVKDVLRNVMLEEMNDVKKGNSKQIKGNELLDLGDF
ncbi:MAG: hypothetical protein RR851_02750 [Clostridium sp.]